MPFLGIRQSCISDKQINFNFLERFSELIFLTVSVKYITSCIQTFDSSFILLWYDKKNKRTI